jgi:hypothetical protein
MLAIPSAQTSAAAVRQVDTHAAVPYGPDRASTRTSISLGRLANGPIDERPETGISSSHGDFLSPYIAPLSRSFFSSGPSLLSSLGLFAIVPLAAHNFHKRDGLHRVCGRPNGVAIKSLIIHPIDGGR